jgi:Starch synthase catalytic domain
VNSRLTIPGTQVNVDLDGCEVGYYHKVVDGVDFVFVDQSSYRRPGGMYGDGNGVYGDNQWRFKLLCQAALEAPLRLELPEPGRGSASASKSLKQRSEEAEGEEAKGQEAEGEEVAPAEVKRSVYGQECIFVANGSCPNLLDGLQIHMGRVGCVDNAH